jgi:cytosine/adenosine deaminase-related metal-dependent hydrolase
VNVVSRGAAGSPSTAYWLERAWLGDGTVADQVLVTVEDGRFSRVEAGVGAPPAYAQRLLGLSVPGLANCHSHAFHRALRGRTHEGRGTFWSWREQMYAVAAMLDPDSYYELARATYREMALAGVTSVGEFHYLHHGPDGTPYADPNAMGRALLQAARDAGVRIALLDTCYLAAGIGKPPEGVQVRFSDGTADAWAERVAQLATAPTPPVTPRTARRPVTSFAKHAENPPQSDGSPVLGEGVVVVGGAVHSVRAVPREQLTAIAAWAEQNHAPLHVHLSEQVAENEACLAAYAMTPTEVLADAGVLGERTTAVHATHLTDRDVSLLGGSGTTACFCPTTERDLADGIGPSRRLHDSGSPLTLGSDGQAVIDLFEEMRAVELDARLATQERGHWSADELLRAGTYAGHRSLGFEDTGRIQVGCRADLVTLDTRSVRTAGTGAGAATAVFAASATDVTQVVRDGVVIATAADREDAGAELDRVISRLWKKG